jgi:hypothetical protein
MDKVIFLFHRKDGLSREEFFDHYLRVHIALGMRLTKTMDGYTVNLTDVGEVSPDAPDAITEVWTRSAVDFMDVDKSFDSPEAAAELMADHDSFIGPYDAYLVEEHVVRGGAPGGPLGSRTPGVKRVSLHRDGDAVPDAGPAATCVVEHHVVKALTPDALPVDVILFAWAPDAGALAPAGGRAFLASEYRQKEPSE